MNNTLKMYWQIALCLFILFSITSEQDLGYEKDYPRPGRHRRYRLNCPRECICAAGNTYCDNIGLRSVPRHLPSDAKFIYMRDNYIRRLPYRRFRGLHELRHLLLKGNRLSEIEHTAFKEMPKLISLSLTDNQLNHLPPDVFYGLLNLRVLSIRHNKLRRLEGVFDKANKLQLVNLGNNRIKAINVRMFQYTVRLSVIDMHRNRITYVAPNAFINLPHLKYLVLRENPLTQVTLNFNPMVTLKLFDASDCKLTEVVRGLPKIIDDLRLNDNFITELKADDFKKTKKIRLLVLNNNQLKFIHQKALSGLQELYDLYVGKNQLTEVPVVPKNIHGIYANFNNITKLKEGTFQFSTRLEFIFLRFNDIMEIEDTAFHGLRYVRSFDLGRNKIMQLKRYTFLYMNRLELLDLTMNPLEELEYGCFLGLRSLHILQMSSVKTKSSVSASTFRDMHKLLFLDLSNSSTLVQNLAKSKFALPPFTSVEDLNLMDDHIHMLPPDFPSFFPHLKVIKLVGNPWHCNRTILWLVDWIKNSTVEFYASNYMTCASPPELKGRALQSLQPTELRYDPITENRINLDDYELIFEIIGNGQEGDVITPGELNLDIFSKRGSETAGFNEINEKDKIINADSTYLNPYGQISETMKFDTVAKKTNDQFENSVFKDDDPISKGEASFRKQESLSPEKIQELREGTTLHEIYRPAGAFSLYDDSSGFVSNDEFLTV